MTQILPTLPMTTTDGKFLAPGGQEIVKCSVGEGWYLYLIGSLIKNQIKAVILI